MAEREIYVRFTVDADSHDLAKAKLLATLQDIELLILDAPASDKQEQLIKILSSFKIVNPVKF